MSVPAAYDVPRQVFVKVLEVSGVDKCNFIELACETARKYTTEDGRKAREWGDEFTFAVAYDTSKLLLSFNAKKGLLRKEFVTVAVAEVALGELACPSEQTAWYDIDEPSVMSAKKKKRKDGAKGVGQVRLTVRVTPGEAKVDEDRLRGLVRSGAWTAASAGGSLIGETSAWHRNPQFLLHVLKKGELTLELAHRAKETRERLSFYIFKYDEAYGGARQPLFVQAQDLVPFGNLNQPLPDQRVHGTFKLAKGTYVVMPATEDAGVEGKFRLSVFAGKHTDDDEGITTEQAADADAELRKKTEAMCTLSKQLPDSGDGAWKEHTVAGAWTEATAGGGNIAGRLAWTKNPQFVFWLGGETECTITLEREIKDEGIGFYVVKHPGEGRLKSLRKLVHYDNEFCKTSKFLRSYVVGVSHVKPEPKTPYVIIPCTHDPHVLSEFKVSVWTKDDKVPVKLRELSTTFLNRIKLKSEWRGDSMGGGPTERTFFRNPQFLLTVNADSEETLPLVVQVLQQPDPKSIGFVVFRSPHERGDENARLETIPPGSNAVAAKVEGFAQVLSVAVPLTLDRDDAERHSFIIVPSTFKPKQRKAFQLNVWSDADFDLVPLPAWERGDESVSEASESGGGEVSAETDEDEKADDDHGETRRKRLAAQKQAANADDAESAESNDDFEDSDAKSSDEDDDKGSADENGEADADDEDADDADEKKDAEPKKSMKNKAAPAVADDKPKKTASKQKGSKTKAASLLAKQGKAIKAEEKKKKDAEKQEAKERRKAKSKRERAEKEKKASAEDK